MADVRQFEEIMRVLGTRVSQMADVFHAAVDDVSKLGSPEPSTANVVINVDLNGAATPEAVDRFKLEVVPRIREAFSTVPGTQPSRCARIYVSTDGRTRVCHNPVGHGEECPMSHPQHFVRQGHPGAPRG